MNWYARLAERFRRMPIRRKLTLVFVATVTLALTLAGVAIVVADSVLFYDYLRRDLSTFVRIIGDNSTGALAFRDARAASENLAALRARPHVQTACLYYSDGSVLAKYSRAGFTGVCPDPGGPNLQSAGGVLVASYPIHLENRLAGTLVLRYDLGEIGDRVRLYSLTVLLTLILSSIVALMSSSKLRALIAQPILELAGAAHQVSQSRDYSIRARKLSQDEVGELADALNQMLEGIQSRDNDLRKALAAQREAVDRLAQLNADLKRSNTELARSNQDLERFAFVASHDLQEPLRMITSYSQLLVAQYAGSEDPRTAQYVDQIVGGTRRMRELLSDLLTYTEIAGSAEQEAAPVDLSGVVEKVTQTLATRIHETGAEVTHEQLPVLNAHEGRMTSLFLNLISNALKYRGNQRPRVHVSVLDPSPNGAGDHYTFSVADNGIGIAPEYHQKIFAAFKRLHGREIPGTGIGLAICERIVERYGGRIWVESEPGAGSKFRFTLPEAMKTADSQERGMVSDGN